MRRITALFGYLFLSALLLAPGAPAQSEADLWVAFPDGYSNSLGNPDDVEGSWSWQELGGAFEVGVQPMGAWESDEGGESRTLQLVVVGLHRNAEEDTTEVLGRSTSEPFEITADQLAERGGGASFPAANPFAEGVPEWLPAHDAARSDVWTPPWLISTSEILTKEAAAERLGPLLPHRGAETAVVVFPAFVDETYRGSATLRPISIWLFEPSGS